MKTGKTRYQLVPPDLSVRIQEACRMTGIGRSKRYELIAQGEIEVIKVGAITLAPVEGLRAFIEGRRERHIFGHETCWLAIVSAYGSVELL